MLKTTNFVLMGDYNIDYLNQPEQNHLDSVLNQFTLSVCCPLIPKRLGKTSETHIDYIIKENVHTSFVFDIPFKTDHFASILFGSEKMRDRKPIEKLIFDKSRFNRDEFRTTLRSLDWDLMYNQCSADSTLYIFISLITGALKQHAPLKKVFIRTLKLEKHLKSEWFDDECKCLLQKKPIALKLYQRQTSAINWEKYKILRAEFSELIAKNQSGYRSNLLETFKSSRKTWNFINNLRNTKSEKSRISALMNSFGELITEDKKIANLLNYTFSHLGDYYRKNYQIISKSKLHLNCLVSDQPPSKKSSMP